MAPSRVPVLVAALLAATSSAVDFSGQNDITQSVGTVAPGAETQTGASNFRGSEFQNQWMQTESPPIASSGDWNQPANPESPSVWTQTSGQASGTGWSPPASTETPAVWTPSMGESSGYVNPPLSVDSSGSNDGVDYGSLECSGSDEEEESQSSVQRSTAGSENTTPAATTTPTTTSQGSFQPPSTASLSGTNSPTTSDTVENSGPTTTSSSQTGAEEDSSQTTQTTSTASSYESASSSTTETATGEQENPAQPSSNSTSSAKHAPFGTIKSKPGECVVGDPDTYISTKDLQWIWDNRMKAEVEPYDNWIMDHIVANKGTLNYCIRWDSKTTKLSKAQAAKFQAMLTRQYNLWNHWLIGYNCWPYDEIKINIVGWAAREASNLEWSDDSLGKLYIGDVDKDGAPQCPESCYRAVDGSSPGGSDCDGKPFDAYLQPTQGMGGGLGTYNFQQVDLDDMMAHIDDDQLTIVAHEIGHSFGLPDFYQQPKPANFKPCLMDALTSNAMRDTDGWMVRRVLENKKSKYNF